MGAAESRESAARGDGRYKNEAVSGSPGRDYLHLDGNFNHRSAIPRPVRRSHPYPPLRKGEIRSAGPALPLSQRGSWRGIFLVGRAKSRKSTRGPRRGLV